VAVEIPYTSEELKGLRTFTHGANKDESNHGSSTKQIWETTLMEMRKVLTLVVATGTAIIFIIGLINLDLFVSLWTKVLVVVVLVGCVAIIVKTLVGFR